MVLRCWSFTGTGCFPFFLGLVACLPSFFMEVVKSWQLLVCVVSLTIGTGQCRWVSCKFLFLVYHQSNNICTAQKRTILVNLRLVSTSFMWSVEACTFWILIFSQLSIPHLPGIRRPHRQSETKCFNLTRRRSSCNDSKSRLFISFICFLVWLFPCVNWLPVVLYLCNLSDGSSTRNI